MKGGEHFNSVGNHVGISTKVSANTLWIWNLDITITRSLAASVERIYCLAPWPQRDRTINIYRRTTTHPAALRVLAIVIWTMASSVFVAGKRKIVYDVVSLAIIEDPSQQAAAAVTTAANKDNLVRLDVLLLHGMAPVGRKCWGYKDHTGNNKSVMKNGKLASENVSTFIESIRQLSKNEISHVKLIMPDRPGYCDSDTAPSVREEEGGVDGGTAMGYSYAQFASDMLTVIKHATTGDEDDDDDDKKRHLIILGTSSGGPCALAVRNRILSASNLLPNHVFLGTIICSSDCPYSHPQCPQAVTEEDAKDLNGRSIEQYAHDESLKRFRRKSKHGFVTDYLLERSDWGFDLAAPSRDGSGDDRAHYCCERVHMYVGGENDYKSIRLGVQFLKELIGGDATLQILEDEDHFYASRKPEVLAKLLVTMMSPR